MNSKRLLDALRQSLLQMLFLALAGLLAILVMIIPEYICKGVMWFQGDLNAKVGVGNLIVAIFGIIASMIAMLEFSKKAGVDAGLVAIQSEGKNTKLNIIYPIITFVIALLLYTAVSFVVGFDYVAGAVKTLAPFMAGAGGNETFTNIDINIRFTAFIIVTVPQIPMMFVGYIMGFKNRMKALQA